MLVSAPTQLVTQYHIDGKSEPQVFQKFLYIFWMDKILALGQNLQYALNLFLLFDQTDELRMQCLLKRAKDWQVHLLIDLDEQDKLQEHLYQPYVQVPSLRTHLEAHFDISDLEA